LGLVPATLIAFDGDQIVAKDENGKTVGVGTLHDKSCPAEIGDLARCFRFTIPVKDAEFYEFDIDGETSEKVTRSKLEHDDWRALFVL
jgi:hypothetical protein